MAPGRLRARMAATGVCVCVFVCWDRRWQVAEEVRSQDGVERRNQGPGLAWPGCWVLGAVSGGALVLCERSWEGSVEKASSHG